MSSHHRTWNLTDRIGRRGLDTSTLAAGIGHRVLHEAQAASGGMMTHRRSFLHSGLRWALALAFVAAPAFGTADTAYAASATLVLQPSSGPPPSVSGRLSGTGWCYPPANGSVIVSGTGVTGSASINSSGNLSGSFTVTGSAGQIVTISVSATCRTGGSLARANFTFTAPPPTRTPTEVPPLPQPASATPTSTSTATATLIPSLTPSATATIPPAPSIGTLTIVGCTPAASQVQLGFLLLDASGAPSTAPNAATTVPVNATGNPQVFEYAFPPADPGALFQVTPKTSSPNCPPNAVPQPTYWTAGNDLHVGFVMPGNTKLEASSLWTEAPHLSKEIYLGSWVTVLGLPVDFGGNDQVFRWSTEVKADAGLLQASLLPFPGDLQADPFSPPGLVASWPVTCVNCEFSIPMAPLAPPQASGTEATPTPAPGQHTFQEAPQLFVQFMKDQFQALVDLVLNLFGKNQPNQASAQPLHLTGSSKPGSSPMSLYSGKAAIPPLTLDYYFRILPLKDGQVIGAQSNPDRFHWSSEPDSNNIVIYNCNQTPDLPQCATPNVPKPYIFEIVGYHGFIDPVDGHVGCFLVTQTTTIPFGVGATHTYYPDDKLCPPAPKSKSWYEAFFDFLSDAWNTLSKAFDELKGLAVDFILSYTPLGGTCQFLTGGSTSTCQQVFKAGLDAGLIALGVPPSIPNFDELMNKGLDYVAEQAVAQIGVPPDLANYLDQQGDLTNIVGNTLEEKAREYMKEQLKSGLQQGLKDLQYHYADSISWLPKGVPLKPDPQGDVQPPTLMIRVTRDANVPDTADTCKGSADPKAANMLVWADVTNPFAANPTSVSIFNSTHKTPSGGSELDPNRTYQLYESKGLPLPNLKLGDSLTIPVGLKPATRWGVPLGFPLGNEAQEYWRLIYLGGTMNLGVQNPCAQGATLKTPADGSFTK